MAIIPNETKSYNISDDWRDLDIFNEIYVKSEDGVVSKIMVNGEDVGGGGGSSDFSTAEVDVTVNGEETFFLADAITVSDEEMYWVEGFETMSYTMVLYKGTYEGTITTPEGYKVSSATGTGGVTISTTPFGAYTVNITGDGTLTVGITRA
jgi:hypothetical protein